MSEPYLGEIRMFAGTYAPKGWALCDGQLLPINQNQALFSLLGNTYGGDGQVNFALPDYRGRAPVHVSTSTPQGVRLGTEAHTLTLAQMPQHTHRIAVSGQVAVETDPAGQSWAVHEAAQYATTGGVALHPDTLTSAGGSQPHPNMQPYAVINFMIALQGIYPSQT